MLDNYRNSQAIFYTYIMQSFVNNKISHAYLIESNGVSYANDLAIDFAKFLICDNKFDSKICHLINNNSYFGFKIIDCDSEVKKGEILELQKNFSCKSVNDRKMVYFIKDVNKLNKYSRNSILKFLEEPCDNVVAILMCDNVSKVMNTITSRCQVINLKKEEKFDYKKIFQNYYDDSHGDYDSFVSSELNDFFNFYEELESKGIDLLIYGNLYQFNNKNRFKTLLNFGYYYYFDVLTYMLNRNVDNYLPKNSFLDKIVDNNEINDIIRKISVIDYFLDKVNYNVNLNLFVDNFIISMGGILYETSSWN